jgi:hypothetical protein
LDALVILHEVCGERQHSSIAGKDGFQDIEGTRKRIVAPAISIEVQPSRVGRLEREAGGVLILRHGQRLVVWRGKFNMPPAIGDRV